MILKCTISIAWTLLTFTTVAYSQQVEYTYDVSGNRISRNIVVLDQNLSFPKSDSPSLKSGSINETQVALGDFKIIIYPNPTEGQLKIHINRLDETQKSSICVFSMSGVLLRTLTHLEESNILDLTDYPIGTYIMKISIGDMSSEWKIIKR